MGWCASMAKVRYGTPYKGSKAAIAEWVVSNLPPSNTFVDLFAGGCAVTHAAMVSGRFGRFVANDLGEAPDVFKAAIDGEFADVVQAVCNLVDAFGECAFDDYMEECAERNRERGRM